MGRYRNSIFPIFPRLSNGRSSSTQQTKLRADRENLKTIMKDTEAPQKRHSVLQLSIEAATKTFQGFQIQGASLVLTDIAVATS